MTTHQPTSLPTARCGGASVGAWTPASSFRPSPRRRGAGIAGKRPVAAAPH